MWGLGFAARVSFVTSHLFICCVVPKGALAGTCSDYDREVFALADQARRFQQSDHFKEIGFSTKGPYHSWLKKLQDLSNAPEARDFMARFGIVPMQIYQIADEYRTAGFLDDFYADLEREINQANNCE